jgi:2-oxo-3-hexenedioate decarboxylase
MLGEELVDLHENPRLIPPFSERHPGLTPQAGYAAARALHAHRLARGWKPAGRKIGFTNRTLWARYGVHEPMWGTVYDHTLILAKEDHASDRASVSLQGLVQPRIEPEICFKLKAPPRSHAEKDLLESIEWMAHSVEIVQCHHPDWKVTIADCCADNGLHGRLVVGTAIPIENPEKLPRVEARLFKGERLVDRGVGANVLGSPLTALGFLIEILKKQPEAPPLTPGEIVTTGVLTDAHPVAPGEGWHTELAGLPLRGLTIDFS